MNLPEHYSSIKAYWECPKKYFWSHIKQLEPIKKNINLAFGSAIHDYASGFPHISNEIKNAHIDNIEKDFENECSCDRAKFAKLSAAIRPICELLEQEIEKLGTLALITELKFYNKKYNFYGTVDAVGSVNKKKTIVEYKTASCIDISTARKASLTLQEKFYAVGQEYTCSPGMNTWVKFGVPVESIIRITIKKPTIRMKRDESKSEYSFRVKQEYILNKDNYIFVNEIEVTDKILKEAEQNLKNALSVIRNTANFFMNTYNCIMQYGQCQFFNLCHHNIMFGLIKKERKGHVPRNSTTR